MDRTGHKFPWWNGWCGWSEWVAGWDVLADGVGVSGSGVGDGWMRQQTNGEGRHGCGCVWCGWKKGVGGWDRLAEGVGVGVDGVVGVGEWDKLAGCPVMIVRGPEQTVWQRSTARRKRLCLRQVQMVRPSHYHSAFLANSVVHIICQCYVVFMWATPVNSTCHLGQDELQ